MTKIKAVEVHVTKRQWRVYTDTGWTFAHWALTDRGLRAQVQRALHACGFKIDGQGADTIVDLARWHGYVTLRAQ